MASIKYKDNGEYKDIVVKVGDTQPIGTIVDYDGTEVPNGWEEVNDYELILQIAGSTTTTSYTLPKNLSSWKKIIVVVNNFQPTTLYTFLFNVYSASQKVSIPYIAGDNTMTIYDIDIEKTSETTINVTCNRGWGNIKLYGIYTI